MLVVRFHLGFRWPRFIQSTKHPSLGGCAVPTERGTLDASQIGEGPSQFGGVLILSFGGEGKSHEILLHSEEKDTFLKHKSRSASPMK